MIDFELFIKCPNCKERKLINEEDTLSYVKRIKSSFREDNLCPNCHQLFEEKAKELDKLQTTQWHELRVQFGLEVTDAKY